MLHATSATADITVFCGLEELGPVSVGPDASARQIEVDGHPLGNTIDKRSVPRSPSTLSTSGATMLTALEP